MKKIVISVIAALAITSPAFAAPEPVAPNTAGAPIHNAAAEAAAKADIDILNETLQNAVGVSYKSTISYANFSGPTPGAKQATTDVIVQRPALISIKVSTAGNLAAVLASDGKNFVLYDVPSAKYVQSAGAADFNGTMKSLQAAGQLLYTAPTESGTSLRTSLAFPLSFLSGQILVPQPPAGGSLHYSENTVVDDGKTVKALVEDLQAPGHGAFKLVFLVDRTTGLLTGQKVESLPASAPPVTVFQETFSDFKIFKTALSPSTFSFTPPASATLVTPPTAPSPASPDQSAPSPDNQTAPSIAPLTPGEGAPVAPSTPTAPGAPSSPSPGPGQPISPGNPAPSTPLPPAPPI